MSAPGEKLCQCGYALGIPGAPQVRFEGRTSPVYVHDLPGATEVREAIVCPCCRTVSYWTTDCAAVRAGIERRKREAS